MKYTDCEEHFLSKKDKLISVSIIAICLLLLLLIDFEGTTKIFTRIGMGIIASFTSIWGIIVSIPLGVWLLLLILK